jgi:predicted outer membrane repeat protein
MTRNVLLAALAAVLAGVLLLWPRPAEAGGVVGTGSAGSCNAGALHNKLAGGGLVTFNCGAGAVTIVLSATETITRDTTIQGIGNLTISGGDAVTLFHVSGGQVLITDLFLSDGRGANGGAILQDGGALTLDTVIILSNTATVRGGALYSSAPLTVTTVSILSNTAGLSGGAFSLYGHSVLNTVSFGFNKAEYDGAVHNQGTLSLTHGIFFSNTATLYYPGALANLGTADIVDSRFVSNTSHSIGGALFNAFNAHLRLLDSIFVYNQTGYGWYGGGVYNLGSLWVDGTMLAYNSASGGTGGGLAQGQDGQTWLYDSTLIGNLAEGGGGLVTSGTVVLSNTTFFSNTAFGGGGILAQMGTLTITNATLAGNSALGGYDLDSLGAQVAVHNTILSGLNNGACAVSGGGSLLSLGHNLGSDNTCHLSASGDLTDTDPLLGPPSYNDGPTITLALLPGSPAINAADNNGCPATDQRGFLRVGACDIGAFEVAFRTVLPVVRR